MVEEVRVVLEVDDSGVVSERLARRRHHQATVRPWTGDARTRRISDIFTTAIRRIDQIPKIPPLINPWPLLIARRPRVRPAPPRPKALRRKLHLRRPSAERNHILVELNIPQPGISPVEIRLSAIVNVDRRINLIILHQRLAQRIFIRALHAIRNRDSNCHAPALLLHRHVEVELPVARNHLARPRTVVGPAEGREVHYHTMVLPVGHVG